MYNFKNSIVGILATIGVSACGGTEVKTQPVSSAEYALDFQQLLSRTDEVAVCVRHMTSKFEIELGPNFLPAEFVPLSCECTAQSMRYMVAGSPHPPELVNAAIQMALNFDVQKVINENDGFVGLLDYMHTTSMDDFGFDYADWSALSETIHRRAKEMDELNPDVERDRLFESSPACKQFHAFVSTQFPELDHRPYSDDLTWFLAQKAIERDPGLSISEIDGLLTADNPGEACLRYIDLSCAKASGECVPNTNAELSKLRCDALEDKTQETLSDLNEKQRLFGQRLIAAYIYFNAHHTSAGRESLDTYIESKIDGLGVSQSDLDKIRNLVKAHQNKTNDESG